MGTTEANRHRTAKALSIIVWIWAITQYNVATKFINNRKLGHLVNIKHCNIVQKLDDLEDYSNENR